MTLVFPRAMPRAGALGSSFELDRVDYLSPEAGGRLGAVAAGFPLWRMMLGLTNMAPADAEIWRAWVTAQRGAQRRFYGSDPDYSGKPRFHAKGRPFTSTAAEWSQAIDGEGNAVLTLGGMLSGMVLSIGDYVGFRWGDTKRSLVRVIERGIATGSGALTVTVEPPVPSVTPAGAVSYLDRPTCLMRLVTGETELGQQITGYTAAGGQIVALQDLVA